MHPSAAKSEAIRRRRKRQRKRQEAQRRRKGLGARKKNGGARFDLTPRDQTCRNYLCRVSFLPTKEECLKFHPKCELTGQLSRGKT